MDVDGYVVIITPNKVEGLDEEERRLTNVELGLEPAKDGDEVGSRYTRIFQLSEAEAEQSATIKQLIEDAGTDNPIPLMNVDSQTFEKVKEWLAYRAEHPLEDVDPTTPTELDEWSQAYVEVGDNKELLFALTMGANYLDIKSLLDVSAQGIANLIKGKTTEEIREMFNIENDWTPEEEEQVRREHEWCESR